MTKENWGCKLQKMRSYSGGLWAQTRWWKTNLMPPKTQYFISIFSPELDEQLITKVSTGLVLTLNSSLYLTFSIFDWFAEYLFLYSLVFLSVMVLVRSCIPDKNTNNIGVSMNAVAIFGGNWWKLPSSDILGGDMSLGLIFLEELNGDVSRTVGSLILVDFKEVRTTSPDLD